MSDIFAMSCSLAGSFFFRSPSKHSKTACRKQKHVRVASHVHCASRGGLACSGAFNGRSIDTIATFRIVGCSCRSLCTTGGACKRSVGASLKGTTSPVSTSRGLRRSTLVSCITDIGCSCSSGCCTDFDFHESNSSHLSPSAH